MGGLMVGANEALAKAALLVNGLACAAEAATLSSARASSAIGRHKAQDEQCAMPAGLCESAAPSSESAEAASDCACIGQSGGMAEEDACNGCDAPMVI
jgi:hypothetical protein